MTTRRTVRPAGAPRRPRKPDALSGPTSLTDRAYADIEEMIVSLQLAPGSAVSEPELSARLGIGRTPIREALQRLARERLVQILPRRGIIVSPMDVAAQLRLLAVRRELERLIARSAARNATDDERAQFIELASAFEAAAAANDDVAFLRVDRAFNVLCSSAAHNEFAAGAMSLLHALSRRFWYLHHKRAADMPLTAQLHADIARAIADRRADDAGAASDRLIDTIDKFTRDTLAP